MHVQEPKKGINIKNLGRTPPPPRRPPPGTPDQPNSLCLEPLFPSRYRKKAYIKNFERGGLGGPKILYAELLRVRFFALDMWVDRLIASVVTSSLFRLVPPTTLSRICFAQHMCARAVIALLSHRFVAMVAKRNEIAGHVAFV